MKNKKIKIQDWQFIPYKIAWEKQRALKEKIIAIKRKNREKETKLDDKKHIRQPTENYLIFCEHPHVYTLGKSGKMQHLLLAEPYLKQKGIDFFHIERGGDITYHGPGQLVMYPIFDLENFKTDIIWFIRSLEQIVIDLLAEYGIQAERLPKFTGVWLDTKTRPRKIAAIGVHTSRWVTMHGLALNVNTQLEYFSYIVPCGIPDKGVTSIAKELGKEIPLSQVKEKIIHHLQKIFSAQIEIIPVQ